MFYFTGKPCMLGHVSKRYTKSRQCYMCKQNWREENKHRYTYNAYHKSYYQRHKTEILGRRSEYNKQYHRNNRDRLNILQQGYFKENMKDPAFAAMQTVRRRILIALKRSGLNKSSKTVDLIGCTIQELKRHLEGKFLKGMSWENRQLWQIDHIVPLNFFLINYDLSKKSVQQIAFHHSNLQPLWSQDNNFKSDKILRRVAEEKILNIKKKLVS